MKRVTESKKGLAAFASIISFALLMAGCSGSGSTAGGNDIKPSDLPSSGAKTFITSQAGVTGLLQNIDEEIDVDELEEEFEYNVDFESMFETLGEELGESQYIEDLTEKFSEAVSQAEMDFSTFESTGKLDFSINLNPGKATDLSDGITMDIPEAKANVKLDIDDMDNPTKGNVNAAVSIKAHAGVNQDGTSMKADVDNLNVSVKASMTPDSSKNALKIDGTIGEKLTASVVYDGISIKVNKLDTDLSLNGNYDGSKADGKAKLSTTSSAELIFDSSKFDMDYTPIKYLKSYGAVTCTLDGNPAVTDSGDLEGSVKCTYESSGSTGISFVTDTGKGGKAIFKTSVKFAGTVDLENTDDFEERMDEILETLFDDEKLSEEEFKQYGKAIDMKFSLKFYDDDNKETLAFADLKTTYDVYSYIYDMMQTAGMDYYDLEELFEDLEESVEDEVEDFLGSSYGNDYSSFDYDDYDDYYYDYW